MRPTIVLNGIRKIDLEGISRTSIKVEDLVAVANYVNHLETQLRETQKEIQRLDLLNALKIPVSFEQYA